MAEPIPGNPAPTAEVTDEPTEAATTSAKRPAVERPEVERVASQPAAPAAAPAATDHPQRIRELTARVESAWRRFIAVASSVPSERMDERLTEDGWTRKQMLAHIAAWHDLTHDRLGQMILTGKSVDLGHDTDAFNARVARQAVGRTAGEVVKELEMTFNRLRRQLGRMTDQQLSADDGWAADVIAGNTYEHYEEHWADILPASAQGEGQPARR